MLSAQSVRLNCGSCYWQRSEILLIDVSFSKNLEISSIRVLEGCQSAETSCVPCDRYRDQLRAECPQFDSSSSL
jgi:hypothetical protein